MQSLTAIDANNSGIAAAQGNITVNSATIQNLTIAVQGQVAAQTAFGATVTGTDAYGNTANTYTGTINLTSSDANGVPSLVTAVNANFTSGQAVQKNYTGLVLRHPGVQTLYARDASSPNTLAGSANITVTPLNAASLALSGFATTVTAGSQGNVTITALDANGFVATGYAGTVAFASSDPNAILPSNTTFISTDLGVKTVPVTLKTAGVRNIVVSDTNSSMTVTQSGITVNPAGATQVRMSFASSSTPTTALSGNVTLYDAYGNVATNYTGTINLTSTDASGTPSIASPMGVSYAGANLGVRAVSGVQLRTPGTQSINANDSVQASISGSSVVIVTAQPFVAEYDFTPTSQGNYLYDANKLTFTSTAVALSANTTLHNDANSTNFNLGTHANTTYDTTLNRLRVTWPTVTASPLLVFSGGETFDHGLSHSNTIDPAFGSARLYGNMLWHYVS